MKQKAFLKIINYKIIISIITLILNTGNSTHSQSISTFEEYSLPVDTSINGSDLSHGFQSGLAFFPNQYDTVWESWSGFSISTMRDDSTQDYLNQYSAITSGGYNSPAYAVAYAPSKTIFTGYAAENTPAGFYITNSTYAYLTMLNGDFFCKKFGGTNGNDPDWFLLHIINYYNGQAVDTVGFYLADFRFANNNDDYIVNSWEWVDLTSLGATDSLHFALSSSDTGTWGMNTPAYFCIDNFTINAYAGTDDISTYDNAFIIWPNPAKNIINIARKEGTTDAYFKLFNLQGQTIVFTNLRNDNNRITISNASPGLYIGEITYGSEKEFHKIIIQ